LFQISEWGFDVNFFEHVPSSGQSGASTGFLSFSPVGLANVSKDERDEGQNGKGVANVLVPLVVLKVPYIVGFCLFLVGLEQIFV